MWNIRALLVAFVVVFNIAGRDAHAVEMPKLHEDPALYSAFLPPEVESKITHALSKINFSEASLSKIPSVQFKSSESKATNGDDVVNRVHYFAQQGFDIWVMRQNIQKKSTSGVALEKSVTLISLWAFVGIVVDKSQKPPKAYYLEFAAQDVVRGTLPHPRPMRAPCSRCHASGPRLMRPDLSLKSDLPAPETLNLMAAWNKKIENYGRIEDVISQHEMIRFPRSSKDEVQLKIPGCVECHNNSGGVRTALTWWNVSAVAHLHSLGAMPYKGSEFTESEHECVKMWTKDPHSTAECRTKIKQATRISDEQMLVGPFKLKNLNATASGDFGDFEIHSLGIKSEQFECAKGLCNLSSQLDMATADSGISLRNKNMSKWLAKNEVEKLQIGLSAVVARKGRNPVPNAFPFTVTLASGNISSPLKLEVSAQCESKPENLKIVCSFTTPGFFLERLGWEKPCFLSLCVSEIKNISGVFEIPRDFFALRSGTH